MQSSPWTPLPSLGGSTRLIFWKERTVWGALPVRCSVAEQDSSGSVVYSRRHRACQCTGAVHFAPKHFLPCLKGNHVLVRSDNTTTIFHIYHHGGMKSAWLLEVSKGLLTWAAPHLTSLRAMYLPRELNLADFLSCNGDFIQWWCIASGVSLAGHKWIY